jgi:hypothetical protein
MLHAYIIYAPRELYLVYKEDTTHEFNSIYGG